MAKELIKLNSVYWLLTLKYEWLYDDINLENHYKVKGYDLKQVKIKEHTQTKYQMSGQVGKVDSLYAACGVISEDRKYVIVGKDTYIGHKEYVTYTDNNLFFHTKKEAIDIVLSLRDDIESFSRNAFENSREVTMKKLKAMNNLKVKIDNLEKQREKL